MSLLGALDSGSTALQVQQAALQVTGNNIANASNADYSRETANLGEATVVQYTPTLAIGTGVDLTSVQRQVDEALNSRLRSATSDNCSANTQQNWLSQVQSAFNALSGNDVKSQMDTFFTSWSTLANDPTDAGQRQVVLQDGQNVATSISSLQGQLTDLKGSVESDLTTQVQDANSLIGQIATLNGKITTSSGSNDNSLLDQRDSDLTQLSQLMNINTRVQPDGSVYVYTGSDELVQGVQSSGIQVTNQTDPTTGALTPTVTFTKTGGTVPVTGGVVGGLLSARSQIVSYQSSIDSTAGALIDEVNAVHASGQGTEGYSTVTGTSAVNDATVPLNSTAAGLKDTPKNGSFVVTVTNSSTGKASSTLVNVNLNGGATQTTLNSLTASLNGINGVTASVTGGQLTIDAAAGNQITFSQDSSNTLASLGINTFFSGDNASNIAVNSQVMDNPNLVAAAKDGDSGDNQNALALSQLGTKATALLNGESLDSNYQGIVNDLGTQVAAAATNVSASQTVVNTLTTQQNSVSGVSLNEEMVNMIQQQNSFSAASRVINAVNTMMQSVISMTE